MYVGYCSLTHTVQTPSSPISLKEGENQAFPLSKSKGCAKNESYITEWSKYRTKIAL